MTPSHLTQFICQAPGFDQQRTNLGMVEAQYFPLCLIAKLMLLVNLPPDLTSQCRFLLIDDEYTQIMHDPGNKQNFGVTVAH